MKPINSGCHEYVLGHGEFLNFMEKGSDGRMIREGTTNEEVLDVLIHRIGKLNRLVPCAENSTALRKIREAKFWLNERTHDRQNRGVEGTGQV